MQIASLAHRVPEMALDNCEALALLRARNADRFSDAQLDGIEQHVRTGLTIAGTERRHITPPGGSVRHLMVGAAREALDKAGVTAGDISLVIYVGVGRGWLEPAMATWVQHELGLDGATGFDVIDACASWLRGLDIAQAMMATGRHDLALLVNCEAGMSAFADLALDDADAIAHAFATFTLGEAATATVLRRGDGEPVYFNFRTFPDHFDLCVIPLPNAASYAPEFGCDAAKPGRFMARSERLVAATVRRIVETYRADPRVNNGDFDVIFSHSASARAIEAVADRLNLPREKIILTHAEFGNTASASIPLAMSIAHGDGRLNRGDRVLAVSGSAGITVGLATFTF